jgi:hypothetical protein
MRARGRDPSVVAGLAFLAANVAHTLDHLRTGTERLTTEVVAGGTAISLLAVATLYLALRRHPQAALAAAATGLAVAADALSWAAMLAEAGTALLLGLTGLRQLRPAPRRGASTAA